MTCLCERTLVCILMDARSRRNDGAGVGLQASVRRFSFSPTDLGFAPCA
jgi:hypothetical protein